MLKVLIKVQMGYESLEFMSEFSYHKGIQFFIQAVWLSNDYFLEIQIALLPLLHQDSILVKLAHKTFNKVGLLGELLEKQVLGERVHEDSFS